MIRRIAIAALMDLLVVALAGCDSSSDTTGYTPKGEELLREVWDMYQGHLQARRRPPAQLSDLDPYEPAAIHGYVALRDGDVVMLWGGPTPSPGASRVLAYQKQVPEQGGLVLYQDGTIKRLTADEFRTTPRSGSL
jgi:hypothetical protein